MQKILTPVLKITHQPPDNLEEYKKEFGSVGVQLHAAVCKARVTVTTQSSSNPSVTQTSNIYIKNISFFMVFKFYIDCIQIHNLEQLLVDQL